MKILPIVVFGLLSLSSFGLEDSIQNRMTQADRYMKTTPVEKMMKDMFYQMSVTMFEDPVQSAEFREILTNAIDIMAITNLTRDKLIIHFTADELSALADFYGSRHGKTAMSKFGVYMADLMPQLQVFIEQAVTRIGNGKLKSNRSLIKPEFSSVGFDVSDKSFADVEFDKSVAEGLPPITIVPSGETKIYPIKHLITNLQSEEGSTDYLNIEIVLEGTVGDFEKVLQMNEHLVRDRIIQIMGDYTPADTTSKEFKNRVKDDFKKGLSSVLRKYRDGDGDIVQEIRFTQFIVQ